MKSPVPQPSDLALHFQGTWASLIGVAAVVVAVAWYTAASRRLSASGKRWPALRSASFMLGAVIVAYAVDGGIVQYETSNFTAHVVQLLLLVDVAPPLLAAGAPVRLALQTSRRRAGTSLRKGLHSRWARALTYPLVAFGIATATMYFYFLTPLYRLSEEHPAWLAYVDLQFLVAGCLLWWVVVARDALPRQPGFGWRFALVFMSVPVNAGLGLAVANATRPLYPHANTLVDTQSGGNVLWGLAEVFIIVLLALLFVDWAHEEERKAVRADRQLDAALAAARLATAQGPDHEGAGEQ